MYISGHQFESRFQKIFPNRKLAPPILRNIDTFGVNFCDRYQEGSEFLDYFTNRKLILFDSICWRLLSVNFTSFVNPKKSQFGKGFSVGGSMDDFDLIDP